MVEKAPTVLKSGVNKEDGKELIEKLASSGCIVELE